MKLDRNRILLFALTGVLVLSALYGAVCSQMCLAGNGVGNLFEKLTCTAISHAYAQIGLALVAFVVLPRLGSLVPAPTTFIPSGYLLSLFRPPRSTA